MGADLADLEIFKIKKVFIQSLKMLQVQAFTKETLGLSSENYLPE